MLLLFLITWRDLHRLKITEGRTEIDRRLLDIDEKKWKDQPPPKARREKDRKDVPKINLIFCRCLKREQPEFYDQVQSGVKYFQTRDRFAGFVFCTPKEKYYGFIFDESYEDIYVCHCRKLPFVATLGKGIQLWSWKGLQRNKEYAIQRGSFHSLA